MLELYTTRSSIWGAVLVTLAMQGCCMEVWKLQQFAEK